jgi:hypothetical protein
MKNPFKSFKRKLQVRQGVYDGRYCTRVVVDKKKQQSKKACKEKINF